MLIYAGTPGLGMANADKVRRALEIGAGFVVI